MSHDQDAELRRALKAYEAGKYSRAHEALSRLIATQPELEPKVRRILAYSRGRDLVPVKFGPDPADSWDDLYEANRRVSKGAVLVLLLAIWGVLGVHGASGKWSELEIARGFVLACSALAMYFLHTAFPYGLWADKRRCKHCGRYAAYVAPNAGAAYLDQNNCEVCGRSYPMPSAYWDSKEGLEEMYERGSVQEVEFYKEFEATYPDYPRSKMASQVFANAKKRKGDGGITTG